MKIKEIKNRLIELLTNKNLTYFYVELNEEYLRKLLVAILKNKRGEFYIPDEEIDALADTLLPTVVAFFSTEEGWAELEAWKKEQEILKQNNGTKAS